MMYSHYGCSCGVCRAYMHPDCAVLCRVHTGNCARPIKQCCNACNPVPTHTAKSARIGLNSERCPNFAPESCCWFRPVSVTRETHSLCSPENVGVWRDHDFCHQAVWQSESDITYMAAYAREKRPHHPSHPPFCTTTTTTTCM
jgi:hypothetical protein